jgi:hypothetical protein
MSRSFLDRIQIWLHVPSSSSFPSDSLPNSTITNVAAFCTRTVSPGTIGVENLRRLLIEVVSEDSSRSVLQSFSPDGGFGQVRLPRNFGQE